MVYPMKGQACPPKRLLRAGGEKGSKKIPGLLIGRPGILPACTLHSLFLEDLTAKNIQAGFLTFGSP